MGDLTEHFDRVECACHHCGELGWGQTHLFELEKLRKRFGFPMVLSSAWRCAEHPEEAQKDEPGAHFHALAIDVRVHGERALRLILAALDLGWGGFGIMQHGATDKRFIHLDRMWWRADAPRPHLWSYT